VDIERERIDRVPKTVNSCELCAVPESSCKKWCQYRERNPEERPIKPR
jgi:hypothetical protein